MEFSWFHAWRWNGGHPAIISEDCYCMRHREESLVFASWEERHWGVFGTGRFERGIRRSQSFSSSDEKSSRNSESTPPSLDWLSSRVLAPLYSNAPTLPSGEACWSRRTEYRTRLHDHQILGAKSAKKRHHRLLWRWISDNVVCWANTRWCGRMHFPILRFLSYVNLVVTTPPPPPDSGRRDRYGGWTTLQESSPHFWRSNE